MKRRHKIICVLIIFFFITGALTFYFVSEKGISGNEWFLMQDETISDVSSYCDEMDEIITLYVGGYMSNDDFKNEETMLQYEFTILKAKYEKLNKDNPVKTGAHSWASKRGATVIQDILNHIEAFISVDYSTMDSETVLANYLVLHETIEDDMAGYYTIRNWIVESETE